MQGSEFCIQVDLSCLPPPDLENIMKRFLHSFRDEEQGLPRHSAGINPADGLSPHTIGRLALRALHQELSAYPKPGLVSPVDNGSHVDMTAATFFRSLFALRSYYVEITLAGRRHATFADLKVLAIAAESRMLQATGGINTHRGGIFNLGLLPAGAGALQAKGSALQDGVIGRFVQDTWGEAIRQHGEALPKTSHGGLVAMRHGVGGAIAEAAAGFPHVFKVGLPVLQTSLAQGVTLHDAAIQSLFGIMSVLPDSNLLYRGGTEGFDFAQTSARAFLEAGGVHRVGWREEAITLHREFVARNLSPGGSADLLAATVFAHWLQQVAG
jgi:triphosphoribosyl-dephospho-CoA synthase